MQGEEPGRCMGLTLAPDTADGRMEEVGVR